MQLSEMQHRTLLVVVFMVGECSGHRRGLKRFDQGGWPAQVDFCFMSIKTFVSCIRIHLDSDLTWEDGPPGYFCYPHKFCVKIMSLMIYRRCVHIMCLLRSYPHMEMYHGDVFPFLSLHMVANILHLGCFSFFHMF